MRESERERERERERESERERENPSLMYMHCSCVRCHINIDHRFMLNSDLCIAYCHSSPVRYKPVHPSQGTHIRTCT